MKILAGLIDQYLCHSTLSFLFSSISSITSFLFFSLSIFQCQFSASFFFLFPFPNIVSDEKYYQWQLDSSVRQKWMFLLKLFSSDEFRAFARWVCNANSNPLFRFFCAQQFEFFTRLTKLARERRKKAWKAATLPFLLCYRTEIALNSWDGKDAPDRLGGWKVLGTW